MNIFIPLILGALAGYLLRRQGKRTNLNTPMNAVLLLLIFLMGINAGRVQISAIWLLLSSVVFAAFTIAGSVGMAILVGRWL
ncbi:hypothetical protein [Thermococcus sp.]|uniref:hypothetical protein n=1 Tax=Thermococcus sp. TaxID=35749 RepID=UPI0025F14066|nr:hypothetical protein [Thermococcus sp.]